MTLGVGLMGHHRAQSVNVDDLHVLALHFQNFVVLESREQSADRFECKAEVAADFLT